MSEYAWATKMTMQFMERDYLLPGQTLDERVDIICDAAERILEKPGFAARFKENLKKGWYSLATPVWTNFGTTRGLPVSCFNSHTTDSMDDILSMHAEVGTMSKHGGGTSGYFGELRPRGTPIKNNGTSHGAVHFMKMFDTLINVVSQGSTRRGQFSATLPIDHGDIDEFLTCRTEGSPIQDLSTGVTVTDAWMQAMIDGDKEKRDLWVNVLNARSSTGYPYIMFVDNVNNAAPEVYKDKGYIINSSNMCQEISLASTTDESFVCVLSSLNILHYDEWKDTDAVELMVYFLDAVTTEFIEKAREIRHMWRAVNFCKRQRALGIGDLGWHSYFQSKMIAWESDEAIKVTRRIEKNIAKKALAASQQMAKEYGEPELLKGYGRRHITLRAIAPTKSSAFILGQVSEGVEPHRSNYYIKDLAKGKFTIKNKHLESLLEEKEMNNDEVWDKILRDKGSVQSIERLSDHEKAVFKTFREISPQSIILLAAERQKYIDQSQSLNLLISPTTPVREVNKLYIDAWKLGIKNLYYQLSMNAAQEFTRELTCSACSA